MSNQSDLIKYSRNSVSDLTLSGGVYLGGTGSANYLDDYEEGTWTPTYNPATTAFTSITYDGATLGKYTKIGQSVYILGVIRTDAISGGAGRIDLGGLPFSHLYGDVSICIGYTTAFAGDHPSGGYLSGSGLIRLTYKTAVSGPLNNFLDISDLGTGGNDNFILFTMTYITSA